MESRPCQWWIVVDFVFTEGPFPPFPILNEFVEVVDWTFEEEHVGGFVVRLPRLFQ